MTDPVLHLEGVVVNAGRRTLLDVASFRVPPGEIVAVIGPNGAGKTTLLHVAALLRPPDAGSATILGTRATADNSAALRRIVSVVFQNPVLFDVRVLENAAAGLRFQGVPRAAADARAGAWLARFGVDHLAGRRAKGLSGGEASRVALARAFATEPALLLLDEPFRALDAPTRASLLPALRDQLRETGTAAVLVTHDRDEAATFADRLAIMASGTVVADGSLPDLFARPPSAHVAELLGVETILRGEVHAIAGDIVRVAILPAGPCLLARRLSGRRLFAGQPLTVTIPAGAVHVLGKDERCPPGTNCLPGMVRGVRSFSSGNRLVAATPAPIVAYAPWRSASTGWADGDEVVVAIPISAAHLIAEDC